MKNRIISGIFFILAGAFIAFGVEAVFPVCKPMNNVFMSCYYSLRSELGLGILIILLGILLLFLSSKQIRIGISISIGSTAVLVSLVPNVLIGVCKKSLMQCNALSRPLWVVTGILTLLAAILNTIYLLNRVKNESYEEK